MPANNITDDVVANSETSQDILANSTSVNETEPVYDDYEPKGYLYDFCSARTKKKTNNRL